MTAKNINAIDLMSRALAGMRFAADAPTMPREVIAYLAPFAHLSGDNDAVSFLVEAMRAETEAEDDGWIDVGDEYPERVQNSRFSDMSVTVEAKFDDGHTERGLWHDFNDGTWERLSSTRPEYLTNIIAWRPMRGDHD